MNIPPEVVAHILHLVSRFSVYDLESVSRVCREWRSLVLSDATLCPWGRVNSWYLTVKPAPRLIPFVVLRGDREEYVSLLSLVFSQGITRIHLEAPINEFFLEFAMWFLWAGVTDLCMKIREDSECYRVRREDREQLRYLKTRSFFQFTWQESIVDRRRCLLVENSLHHIQTIIRNIQPTTVAMPSDFLPFIEDFPFVTRFISPSDLGNPVKIGPSSLKEIWHIREYNPEMLSVHDSIDPGAMDVIKDYYEGHSNITTLRSLVDCNHILRVRDNFPLVEEFQIMHSCDHINSGRAWKAHIQSFKDQEWNEHCEGSVRLKFRHWTTFGNVCCRMGTYPITLTTLELIFSYLSLPEIVRACRAFDTWSCVYNIASPNPVPLPLVRRFPYLMEIRGSTLITSLSEMENIERLNFPHDISLPLNIDMVNKAITLIFNLSRDITDVTSSRRLQSYQWFFRFYEGENARSGSRAMISSFHPIHGCSLVLPINMISRDTMPRGDISNSPIHLVAAWKAFFKSRSCGHEINTTLYWEKQQEISS